jgi:hypothetical protein
MKTSTMKRQIRGNNTYWILSKSVAYHMIAVEKHSLNQMGKNVLN